MSSLGFRRGVPPPSYNTAWNPKYTAVKYKTTKYSLAYSYICASLIEF